MVTVTVPRRGIPEGKAWRLAFQTKPECARKQKGSENVIETSRIGTPLQPRCRSLKNSSWDNRGWAGCCNASQETRDFSRRSVVTSLNQRVLDDLDQRIQTRRSAVGRQLSGMSIQHSRQSTHSGGRAVV